MKRTVWVIHKQYWVDRMSVQSRTVNVETETGFYLYEYSNAVELDESAPLYVVKGSYLFIDENKTWWRTKIEANRVLSALLAIKHKRGKQIK